MTTRDGYTTITISKALKEQLKARKAHPRQSYEEVITDLLGLSPEAIRRIDNLRAELEEGMGMCCDRGDVIELALTAFEDVRNG